MAKCIITFEDDEVTEELVIKVVFDPPMVKANGLTAAQKFGYGIAQELAGSADSAEIDVE